MKNTLLLVCLMLVLTLSALSQGGPSRPETRVIEVTGSAETLVTPDEFTFKITIVERLEKKEKITIDDQERRLREELAKAGIDPAKTLSIYDMTATLAASRRRRESLGSREYRLRLNDVAKAQRLQDIVDDLGLSRLDLLEATHSEMTRIRKETKMEAVRAAKAKAEYMLSSIGERVGKASYIQEIDEESTGGAQRRSSNFYSNSVTSNTTSSSGRSVGASDDDEGLSFTKIRIRYAVKAKFEIE